MKGDLIRFKTAQDTCFTQVLEEIKNGKKNEPLDVVCFSTNFRFRQI